ncbi:non-ribosomal peptide synthetase [Mucilaginibacter sp. E4BP6]|uniref:non-ribosomal peptide synthetase n=1 Tax=Mucilaginibacter sp. E4BP6 TaxID=2723089 RepID=UPI0015C7C2DE|nr:non-ribosomal peptide synthetase [Mucilaginibacter sp. E4BP6]NYE68296.1 amino acid adenylation domain-containing protein [Mucilaginibacter sp. E4BP6]
MKNYNAFQNRALGNPSAIAIKTDAKEITYEALDLLINLISNQLESKGISHGEIVGVYMNPGISYIATILAINKSGAVFMPMEPSLPIKRLSLILNKVFPRVIITDKGLFGELDRKLTSENIERYSNVMLVDVLNHQTTWFDAKEGRESYSSATPNDESNSCYLFYTSGSTGEPKAIEGTVDGLDHFIKWEIAEFNITENTKIPLLAPLSFDVSLRDIFVPLYAGGTVLIPDADLKYKVSEFINWISINNINHIHMVPSFFRLVTSELKLNNLLESTPWTVNNILLAGEPLFYSDVSAWRECEGSDTNLVNLYGPSETSLAKLFFRIGDSTGKDKEIVPLGRPIPGSHIMIIKNGSECRSGEIGEIFIQTGYRSKGYYGDKELTDAKFVITNSSGEFGDIVFKTGDLAKTTDDGLIQFVGRQDNMIKINGNRVELQELEGALSAYKPIEQAIVTVINNNQFEPELALYYVAEYEIDIAQLKQYLSEILPAYMFPSYFIKLQAIPLNFNGKVDRKALPQPPKQVDNSLFAPCEGEVECLIESIWKDVLKLDSVGRDTSFFTIGGSSLKAIQIISRIQKEFHVLIKLAHFFAKPMIKDLAMHVNKTPVQ